MACEYIWRRRWLNRGYDDDEFYPKQTRERSLKIAAQVLDLNPDSSPQVICEAVKATSPSEEWLKESMIAYDQLSNEQLGAIWNYIGDGYSYINAGLRTGAGGIRAMQIHEAIAKMPPLDKDIVVTRRTNRIRALPNRGPFESLGFLSTSVGQRRFVDEPQKMLNMSFMKIRVPKGARALYIPGREDELIFSTGIILEVLGHYEKPFSSWEIWTGMTSGGWVSEHREIDYMLDWYDVEMLP